MASATQAPSGAQAGSYIDPYHSYNFRLEIDGVTEAYFHECSGIGVKVKTVRWRSGGKGPNIKCLPGRVEYSDITLRYGLTNSAYMWQWLQSAVMGNVVRKQAAIVLLDRDGVKEAMRWTLHGAWISEWNGPSLNALGHEVAIEEMVLVYESLQRG